MSDSSPHIRHRVKMPDGKHVEVVYRDHRGEHRGTPARTDASEAPGASGAGREPPQDEHADPMLLTDLDGNGAVAFGSGSEAQQGCVPEDLHVCFNCSGELVYPLDWVEEGPRHWRIVLRCPECEALREGVFEQAIVERLDDELDRGSAALLSDLKRITHANMADEIDFFVRALEADLIVPSDFR
jgi:hypothetical protein